MAKILLSAEAKRDLQEIKTYIAMTLRNPTAATRTVKAITTQIRTLERFPEIGALVQLNAGSIPYRYLLCGNYMAFYYIQKENVLVVRILYGRRNYLSILFGNQWDEEDEMQGATPR